jgi:hypothetical protein
MNSKDRYELDQTFQEKIEAIEAEKKNIWAYLRKNPGLSDKKKAEANTLLRQLEKQKTQAIKAEKKDRYEYLQKKPDLTDEEMAEAKAINEWFQECQKQNSNSLLGGVFLLTIIGWMGYYFVGCVYERTNPEAIIKRETREQTDLVETIKQNDKDKQGRYNKQRDEENRKASEDLRREMEYRRSRQ